MNNAGNNELSFTFYSIRGDEMVRATRRSLLVTVVCCLALLGTAARAADMYVYGTHRVKEVPEVVKQAVEIVSAHQFTKGILFRTYVTHILKIDDGALDGFEAAGFQPLLRLRAVATWSRISNINGWGTEVNGECHRRVTQTWDFEPTRFAEAFATVQRFVDGPRETLENLSAEHFEYVYTGKSVAMFERGFVVSSSIRLTTTTAQLGEEPTELLANGGRSGYYSLY